MSSIDNQQLLFDQDPNSQLKSAFLMMSQLEAFHFPNVTKECKDQFLNYTLSLFEKQLWAFAGLLFYREIIKFKIIISTFLLFLLKLSI